MNKLFGGMIILSFFCAALLGKMPELSMAAIAQAGEAVKLSLSLMGTICLWSGLMRVAKEAGLAHLLAKSLRPLIRLLFRGLRPNGQAAQAVCLNLAANMLGLGNAVTPLGIRAMQEIATEQHASDTASNDMVMLVVLNTASLQLIPATVGLLRAQNGAKAPFDILPAVWCASVFSIFAGVTVAKLLAKQKHIRGLPQRRRVKQ